MTLEFTLHVFKELMKNRTCVWQNIDNTPRTSYSINIMNILRNTRAIFH